MKHELFDSVQSQLSPDLVAEFQIQTDPPRARTGRSGSRPLVPSQLITIKEFSLDETFKILYSSNPRISLFVGGRRYSVRVNNTRYKLFVKMPYCVCCGLKGSFFLLRANSSDLPAAYFTLCGRDTSGDLVMLTRDHIVPKSKGGGNGLSNAITLCEHCNRRKGDHIVGIEELRRWVKEPEC